MEKLYCACVSFESVYFLIMKAIHSRLHFLAARNSTSTTIAALSRTAAYLVTYHRPLVRVINFTIGSRCSPLRPISQCVRKHG